MKRKICNKRRWLLLILLLSIFYMTDKFRSLLSPEPQGPALPVLARKQRENNIFRGDDAILRSYSDSTEKYQILPYMFKAEDWTQLAQRPVCAALQCSLDHFHYLPEFMESWTGPVSLAVFAPSQEFYLATYFARHLRHCYPLIKRKVSFHFVFPADRAPLRMRTFNQNAVHEVVHNCNYSTSQVFDKLLNMRNNATLIWRSKLMYPYNLLRNIARDHCQTEWVSCIDIDMVLPKPSHTINPSIVSQLEEFLRSDEAENCTKCAFVIPVFEIHDTVPHLPYTKIQLKYQLYQELARIFHIESFDLNQKSSQLDRWLEIPANTKDGIHLAYKVDKFEFYYEPIYITKKGSPKFDTRYIGPGMDRNTQAYEMYLQGYNFYMLDNVFLSHWGYAHKKSMAFYKASQSFVNNEIFNNYHAREIAVKYDKDPFALLAKFHNPNCSVIITDKNRDATLAKIKAELAKLDVGKK